MGPAMVSVSVFPGGSNEQRDNFPTLAGPRSRLISEGDLRNTGGDMGHWSRGDCTPFRGQLIMAGQPTPP